MLDSPLVALRNLRNTPPDDLSPDEVVRACEQNYIDYWRIIGESRNAEFSEERGVTKCITGLPQEIFNIVLACNLRREEVNARVDEVLAEYETKRLPGIWQTGKLADAPGIDECLDARGWPHDYDLTAMAVDLETERPHHGHQRRGVTVKEVDSATDCRDWINCLTTSWESPKEVPAWMMDNAMFNVDLEAGTGHRYSRRMFLGFIDGKPSGTAMLNWSDRIAGLQAVGTIQSARHRRVGAAAIDVAMEHARALGFRSTVVLSTVEGVKLYRNAGFKEYGKLPEHGIYYNKLK